ncbi:hypothetical protein DRO56_05875 [Candidatus Bathyarchaeota archaeon]|nr:MAG: YHS domain-containing protein [Candidatus Bathyarchaeota archaeon]RLI30820.1 MAG: hypothetical protein DRO56_05875 [Candidatus Bathyarchaeota archaeon]
MQQNIILVRGKTYYFCCEACKTAFEANPERYLRG